MIQTLKRGQRLPMPDLSTRHQFVLRAELPGIDAPDLSVFGVNEERRLADDRYFIFYNQTASPERAMMFDPADRSFWIDLEGLPLGVHRLIFAATTDDQAFSALYSGTVSLEDSEHAGVRFGVDGSLFQDERALILLELYRHQGTWRVMGVGQGFSGGLQALLENLGGKALTDPAPPSAPSADWGAVVSSISTIFGQPAPSAPENWQPLESATFDPFIERDACKRCYRGSGERARGPLNADGLCRECASNRTEGLQRFRTRFLAACADGILELHEWRDLQQTILRERLEAKEALDFVRADALHFLERTLVMARADGAVNQEEEAVFERLARLLNIPGSMMTPLRLVIADLRLAGSIREGHLPTVTTTAILEAGEVAHLEVAATFRHVTATRSRDIPGRLIVTNRQIHFASAEGGWTIQYGKVLRIEEMPDGVNLELGVKKGSGYYHKVEQPIILSATLDALVRLHKRLLLMPQTERASRAIPHKVKLAVWQRDAGRCVQCSDSNYLEYDHVIPHSLGGASTESNLQLLCRRCNLQKSDRI